ncbi:MAG: DJ-1/PfpI family protein [Bacteroidota bacterium]
MKPFLWPVFLFLLAACAPSPSSVEISYPSLPAPDRVWEVGFLVMDGVYNTELTAPMDMFHHTVFHTEPGMHVFTVAEDSGLIRTFEGLVFQPDFHFDSDSLPPIDVLVVPSAEHHLDSDLENERMISWVQERAKNASYVLSLCDGAFVLAKAGLLDDFASTTFPSDIPTYRKTFPQLEVHEEVLFVHDGKFITSAGGAKSFEPALYLCERLYGKKAADGIARGLVIDWNLTEVPHLVVEEENIPEK